MFGLKFGKHDSIGIGTFLCYQCCDVLINRGTYYADERRSVAAAVKGWIPEAEMSGNPKQIAAGGQQMRHQTTYPFQYFPQ